jgi:predicted exporter
LRDVGLFAGFSLVGAALCTLIFLPHLVSEQAFEKSHGHDHLFERLTIPAKVNKYLIIAIFILTPILFYFARDVKFNSDMMRFNYMSDDLKKAESELYAISDFSLSSVYVVTSGATLEEALQHNERTSRKVKELQREKKIKESLSVSSFIISDSLQKVRIERWNGYWTPERKEQY